jgi:uncharacterized protein YndB with AHSA1/START domain
MNTPITVEALVQAPIGRVWNAFIDPDAIIAWNAASDDWHTVSAQQDVRPGGRFSARMEAKDGSEGFDFSGTYDDVVEHERLAYTMDDGRKAVVTFVPQEGGVLVTETFEAESQNPHEMQRVGWQAILDSFKRYAEGAMS